MKRKYCTFLTVVLLLLASILSSCGIQEDVTNAPILPESSAASDIAEVKVHFIDVGQGDSMLIQLADGKTVLIDGGNKADADTITTYIQSLQVKRIDYLIATHPHEDHIGALPAIIKSFDIGSIYMPKVTANTKIFEDLLQSVKNKGLKINTAAAGVKIIDTKDTKLTILAPNSAQYEELNNYSAVVKLTYIDTAFLFTGDAEDVSEKEMLKNNVDLNANVLKVGHHGGRTSTTKGFLAEVSPEYAVISAGKDNDYGHPHEETLDRLKARNIKIVRTDEQGTIVAASDGKMINIDKTPTASDSKPADAASFYIGNKNSKVFHLPSCSSLPKLENQIRFDSRAEAVNAGFDACGICKP